MILRVDDRYIHGQVIAGWVRPLGISHLILVSDEIAADDWARNTYSLAVPDSVKFSVASTDHLLELVDRQGNKTMIIVGTVKDAYCLIEKGLKVDNVDLGCLGYDDGKCEVCSYIYLSNEDIRYIRAIIDHGIKVLARALPNCPVTDVVKIIKTGKT
jgi:mannose/fructose/N-acetylgalactosamine-specific phosphotransferase system component IIB